MTTARDESVRTLAEALLGYGGASDPNDPELVSLHTASILTASSTLAADLDLGTAWRLAVAALPEGWAMKVESTDGQSHYARAWNGDDAYIITTLQAVPIAALDALRAALEARPR